MDTSTFPGATSVDPYVTAYTSQAQAQVSSLQSVGQAQLTAAQAQGQALLAQNASQAATAARIANAAQGVAALSQSGYNPNSKSSNAQLIQVIAGGLALVPGPGPILAAGLEVLWVVGNAIACPVMNAFSDLLGQPKSPDCGGAPCSFTGTPATPGSVLASSALPPRALWPSGSFQELVIGSLAYNTSQALICKTAYPSGLVVDAIVNVWNQTHFGPAVNVYVPVMPVYVASGIFVSSSFTSTGAGNNCTGGLDPNVYFAFQPIAQINTLAKTCASATLPFWEAAAAPGFPTTAARMVSVNTGPLVPTITDLAVRGAIVVAAGAAATAGYALLTGRSIAQVFASLLE